jgi:hypothetical protein
MESRPMIQVVAREPAVRGPQAVAPGAGTGAVTGAVVVPAEVPAARNGLRRSRPTMINQGKDQRWK